MLERFFGAVRWEAVALLRKRLVANQNQIKVPTIISVGAT